MLEVTNPYNDEVLTELPICNETEVRRAIANAYDLREKLKNLPIIRRGNILNRAAEIINQQADTLTNLIVAESGKPIRYARGEVSRAVETFMFAADAARQLHGETIPMSAAKGGIGKIGYYIRQPIGVVAAITPFNFPLNLVAHKVAPAIAAGCPIVLKPAPATPLTALRLQEILLEAGLPENVFEVVIGDADVGHWLTTDPRIAMISFTGSPAVAQKISEVSGLRPTAFELGGNAATVIHHDADIEAAVERCIIGSFAYSGQVCISVQRIYAHQDIYAQFRDSFLAKTTTLKMGNPLNSATDIGPMISEAASERVKTWVDEAVNEHVQVVTGGIQNGKFFEPTVLEKAQPQMRIMRDEIFGPVVNLIPYTDFDDALRQVDDSLFGLQAGIYTQDIGRIMQAVDTLNVGGVIINDVPTFRVDHMPYGGNKHSGVGREGPRFAIESMTNIKMIIINT